MRILNSPAAVCFTKRISKIPMTTGITPGKVLIAETSQKTCLCIFLNLELSRKELGTLNVRDVFYCIRYFLRFTIQKRISGKKNIYLKVNSAKSLFGMLSRSDSSEHYFIAHVNTKSG